MWVKHQIKGHPSKRSGHSINEYGKYLILFGGKTENGRSNELFFFDTRSLLLLFSLYLFIVLFNNFIDSCLICYLFINYLYYLLILFINIIYIIYLYYLLVD